MWASQVGPDEAVSNLSKWIAKLGISSPPTWVRSVDFDNWIFWISFALIILEVIVLGYLTVVRRNRKADGWAPYRETQQDFSLREAAFLWCGKDPGDGVIFPGTEESAALDMFHNAVKHGTFPFPEDLRPYPDLDLRIRKDAFRRFSESVPKKARSKFPF
jgi:hypothetical protein